MNYTVKKIKKNKESYIVILDDDSELVLNEDLFTDHYFYVGKIFDESELETIKNNIEISKYYQYAVNLITSRLYSSYNIYLKLVNVKKLTSYNANKVIEKLKDKKYLDDTRYQKQLIEELNYKNYGYLKIVNKLKEDGVSVNESSYIYDEEFELEKAKIHLSALLKKYRGQSIKKQKVSMFNAYLRLGFKKEVINLVLSSINDYDLLGEEDNLRKEFIKIIFKMNQDEIADNKQKIIDKLLRKGYKYQTIIKIMEENNGK